MDLDAIENSARKANALELGTMAANPDEVLCLLRRLRAAEAVCEEAWPLADPQTDALCELREAWLKAKGETP